MATQRKQPARNLAIVALVVVAAVLAVAWAARDSGRHPAPSSTPTHGFSKDLKQSRVEQGDIIVAALAYIEADPRNRDHKYTLMVTNRAGDFARVSAEAAGVPDTFYILKQSGDDWVTVYGGTGPVPRNVIDRFRIPGDVLLHSDR